MIALVERRLPERFYREPLWRLMATALIARMAGLLDSITLLLPSHRQSDAFILLRALYEHVVTFCWLLIDPVPRTREWIAHSQEQRRRLAKDVKLFGIDLDETIGGRTLPKLIERADEVDAYWGPRIEGLYVDPAEGPKHLLTMRGLYAVIYRLGSRPAHAEAESIEPCLDLSGYPSAVRLEQNNDVDWFALATPVMAIALVVCHERLAWPDAAIVRKINTALTTAETRRVQTERRRARKKKS